MKLFREVDTSVQISRRSTFFLCIIFLTAAAVLFGFMGGKISGRSQAREHYSRILKSLLATNDQLRQSCQASVDFSPLIVDEKPIMMQSYETVVCEPHSNAQGELSWLVSSPDLVVWVDPQGIRHASRCYSNANDADQPFIGCFHNYNYEWYDRTGLLVLRNK